MKVEGRNAVRELILNGNTTIDKVIVQNNIHDSVISEIVDLMKQKKIRFQFVPVNVLNNDSVTKHHQGIIAYTSEFKYSTTEDILNLAKEKNEDPFILILDGIEDPHNLGSILRVCECLGVHGVIIEKTRACQVNETVIKTSVGATSYVKVARVANINNEIEKLKKQNIWVYACELGGDDLTSSNLTGGIAIVIGSEGRGTGKLTLKLCDGIVTIPQYGKINSLNASVATGIVLYEVSRQRKG
ncbi:MAG: 23S rRNA (guanosine(2251)-2'-O)-methyltransferase RlmB [Eubacteriales bacterium]|nr:23S rRNA (guanosine(2251)-2'-O)-methyltransferase RlmB [Eubacteriales bacterium]